MKRCQQITECLEKSKIERLTLRERLSIKIHLTICKKCKRYFHDSEQLDKWLNKYLKRNTSNVHLSSSEKEAIKLKMDELTLKKNKTQ